MPIRRLLEGKAFAPESVAVIAEAFESVVEMLALTTTEGKKHAAAIMLDIAAGTTLLDANTLRDQAIMAIADKKSASSGR